jgi:hypothetical protein
MALVSIAPLASRWCVGQIVGLSLERSQLLKCAGEGNLTPSISMCLTTTVSDDGVQRRVANHHSNLWDDNFIQSLSTPYGVIFIFEFVLTHIPSFFMKN